MNLCRICPVLFITRNFSFSILAQNGLRIKLISKKGGIKNVGVLEQGSSSRKDINPNCKRNLVRVEYLLQKIFVSKSLDSKESGPNAFLLHFGCCVLVENRDVFFPLLQCVHFRICVSLSL